MTQGRTGLSLLLLIAGLVLVYAGLNLALGLSLAGLVASAAAITALLYVGAVWFGALPRRAPSAASEPVLVFDRALCLASGAGRGKPLASCFPEAVRHQVATLGAVVLQGESTRLTYEQRGARLEFAAVPVRGPDGVVLYGMLMTLSAGAEADRPTAGV